MDLLGINKAMNTDGVDVVGDWGWGRRWVGIIYNAELY